MRAPFGDASIGLLIRASPHDGLDHLCRGRERVFLTGCDAAGVFSELGRFEAMRMQVAHECGTNHLDQTLPPLLLTPLAQMAITREPCGKVADRADNPSIPCPVDATVRTTGATQLPCELAKDCIAFSSFSTRSAPSRSHLFTTKMSAISRMPP